MKNIAEIFPVSRLYENEQRHASELYLRQPIDRVWHEWTWAKTMDEARRIAAFLKAQGLQKGDRIAILSKNCAHWFIADFAITLAEMVSVPLYATQKAEDVEFVLRHAEVKLIFVGKLDNPDAQQAGIPTGVTRVAFPYKNKMAADFQYEDILKSHEPLKGDPLPDPKDIWSLVYTSGTTGSPKGVVYTFEMVATLDVFKEERIIKSLLPENHFISYLPLAHVAERASAELASLGDASHRVIVNFVESIETFNEDIKEARPTMFFAVPRIWTIFQMGILKKMPEKNLNLLLKIPFVGGFVKKKIKKLLGFDRCQIFISGAAPIPMATLRFFHKLDIPICEGYGQTENGAYATLADPKDIRMGSVGKAREGVELRLGSGDELLVKSPANMAGYYKDEELTKESFTDDGFLKTGDVARIDQDGFVYIVGRVKEQFKTAKGEYIAPVPIERKFAQDSNIEQSCLVGSGLKQPVLIVALSDAAKKLDKTSLEKSFQTLLVSTNENLATFEKVSHMILVRENWTPENGLLTATLKLRRAQIEKKYEELISKTQSSRAQIIWKS